MQDLSIHYQHPILSYMIETYDIAYGAQDRTERQCGFGQRRRSKNLSTPDDDEKDCDCQYFAFGKMLEDG